MIDTIQLAGIRFAEWNTLHSDKKKLTYLNDHSSDFKLWIDNDLVHVTLRTIDELEEHPDIEEMNEQLNTFDLFGYEMLELVFTHLLNFNASLV